MYISTIDYTLFSDTHKRLRLMLVPSSPPLLSLKKALYGTSLLTFILGSHALCCYFHRNSLYLVWTIFNIKTKLWYIKSWNLLHILEIWRPYEHVWCAKIGHSLMTIYGYTSKNMVVWCETQSLWVKLYPPYIRMIMGYVSNFK